MRKLLIGFWCCCLSVAFSLHGTPSYGENLDNEKDILKIAAVINDDVISIYDLMVRMEIVIATSNLNDSPQLREQLLPQVMRAMIDEKIQLQESERLAIIPTSQQIDDAIKSLEARNNNAPGSFDKFVEQRKLNRESIVNQIRAGLAWALVVSRRFSSSIIVGENEIDESILNLETARGEPEYLINEIFLPYDKLLKNNNAKDVANNLVQQLRKGANFNAIARQFSQSASAALGGDIGWVLEKQLPLDLSKIAKSMDIGKISNPIHTHQGIYIISVKSKRRVLTADPTKASVTLAQVVLDERFGDQVNQITFLRQLREKADNCQKLLSLSEGKVSNLSGNLGKISLLDLPVNIRNVVSNLNVGVLSEPMPDDSALRAIMVCARENTEIPTPDRKKIRLNIANKRLELMGRRYMRDLRKKSFIDIRLR